jgi:hypothetical protein
MFSVGKTVFVGTTPGRVLIIRPPTDHTQSIPNPHAGLEEWVVHDWDEMREIPDYMRMEGFKEYDWVWLDSISLWQDVGLDDIWAATKDKFPARDNKYSGKDKGEFGRNMDRLSEWTREMVGMDLFNFGITAHPTNKLDDPTGERRMMPWVQGKGMSVGTCGMMTLVGYYEVKFDENQKPYRLLHTETTEGFYCKNQYALPGSPWLPLKNPDMPYVLKKIEDSRALRAGTGGSRRSRKTTPATPGRRRRRATKGAA